jgi:hypothetical protein
MRTTMARARAVHIEERGTAIADPAKGRSTE